MQSFNELIELWYKKDNFKIIDFKNKTNICYVFISSNGLFKYSENVNIKKLINDKYDWENISKSKKIQRTAQRIIYIRDIQTHSYVEGINERIDCIDKIIDLMNELTKGFDVYFVGNSGGGYLAMILGAKLKNTKRIYSFGGIFSLYTWKGAHNTLDFNSDKLFQKHKSDDCSKFYDIRYLLNNCQAPIYHIYASKHEGDLLQVGLLDHSYANLHLMGFNTNIHGHGINGFDYPDFLTCNDRKIYKILSRYENKAFINKHKFSINSFGFFSYITKNIQKVFRHFNRKL